MKGTTFGWDEEDVLEAVEVSLFTLFTMAANEERPEEQREHIEVALRHLENAKGRLRRAFPTTGPEGGAGG